MTTTGTGVEHSPLATNGPAMDLKRIGEALGSSYRQIAAKYRTDDEIEVLSEHHRHLANTLLNLSNAFGRPIHVLDVGCGTGRYFHCLADVDWLVGVDVSEAMLRTARKPVRHEQISARRIDLRWENVYFSSFPSESFDLIYSLGMFGNGCPVTVELLNRFYDWLAPEGQLFFNVVDVATLSRSRRARRRIRNVLYPFLPQRVRRAVDNQVTVPFCGLGKRELGRIMRASKFENFSISSLACKSPLWSGWHLECAATKPFRFP
jgi:ubiquinone/menaquinone biosynthesis C-methylase UbiE